MHISDKVSIIDINDDLLCVGKDVEEHEYNKPTYYLVIFYKNQQPVKLSYGDNINTRNVMYNKLVSILDKLDNDKYEEVVNN